MILSVFILAVSLSIDALGVGIAYGLRKVIIPLSSKFIICLFSVFYSALALIVGKSLYNILPSYASNIIGITILLFMGTNIILKALLNKEDSTEDSEKFDSKTILNLAIKSMGITIQVIKNPAKGDIDKSGIIDKKESVLLGLALSVDAIGVGIGSALTNFHSMLLPPAVGIFQIGFLYIGTYVGLKFLTITRLNRTVIAVLPGILLILMALVQILRCII